MAIYYVDPIAGQTTSGGTSFATRVRVPSLISSAVATGDEIRLMQSPQVSLGSGTWTNNSSAVTFSTPLSLTSLYMGDTSATAWTVSANVTASTTTQVVRPIGNATQTLSIATAFTTGIAAYVTLAAPVSISAFTTLSCLLFSISGTTVLPGISINLCSDAIGTVVEGTLTFADAVAASTFTPSASFLYPLVKTLGSPITNSINSISISYAADPGAGVVVVANIIATNGLDHNCCITPSAVSDYPPLFAISGITPTSVFLFDGGTLNNPPYSGTTTTVASYAYRAGKIRAAAERAFNTSPGNVIARISGGWDSTAMTTQPGLTVLNGGSQTAGAINSNNLCDVGEIDHVTITNSTALLLGPNFNVYKFTGNVSYFSGIISFPLAGLIAYISTGVSSLTRKYKEISNIYFPHVTFASPFYLGGNSDFVTIGQHWGASTTSSSLFTVAAVDSTSPVNYCQTLSFLNVPYIAKPLTYLINASNPGTLLVNTNSTLAALAAASPVLVSATVTANIHFNSTDDPGNLSSLSFNFPFEPTSCVSTNNGFINKFGRAFIQSAIVHTDTEAWQLVIDTANNLGFSPLSFQIGQFTITPSATSVAVSCWVYRTASTQNLILRVPSGQTTATTSTQYSVAAVASLNTWEQLTVTVPVTIGQKTTLTPFIFMTGVVSDTAYVAEVSAV